MQPRFAPQGSTSVCVVLSADFAHEDPLSPLESFSTALFFRKDFSVRTERDDFANKMLGAWGRMWVRFLCPALRVFIMPDLEGVSPSFQSW